MNGSLIKIHGLPTRATPFDGQWVVEYDPTREGVSPEGEPMLCHLVTTPNKAEATAYEDALGVITKSVGTRPDGRPDCPLTAFTLEIVKDTR